MERNQGDISRATNILNMMQTPFGGQDDDMEYNVEGYQDDDDLTRQALAIAQNVDSDILSRLNTGNNSPPARAEDDQLQEALRISQETNTYDDMVRKVTQSTPKTPSSGFTRSRYGGAGSTYGGSQYGGSRSQYGDSGSTYGGSRYVPKRYERTYDRDRERERERERDRPRPSYVSRYNTNSGGYSGYGQGNAPYGAYGGGGEDRVYRSSQQQQPLRRNTRQPFQSQMKRSLKKWLTPEREPSPYRGGRDADSFSESESYVSEESSGTIPSKNSSYWGGGPGPAYSSAGQSRRRGAPSVAASGAPDLDDILSQAGLAANFSAMDPISQQHLAAAGILVEGGSPPQAKDPFQEAREMLADLEKQKEEIEQEQESVAVRAREVSAQIAEVDPMADIQTAMVKMAALAEEYQFLQTRLKDLEDINENINGSLMELRGMLNNQESMQGTFTSDEQSQLSKVMMASLLHEIEQKRRSFKEQRRNQPAEAVDNTPSYNLGNLGGLGIALAALGGGSFASERSGSGVNLDLGGMMGNASGLFKELQNKLNEQDMYDDDDMGQFAPSEGYTPREHSGSGSDAPTAVSGAGSNSVYTQQSGANAQGGVRMVTVPAHMVRKSKGRSQEAIYADGDYSDDEDEDDDDDDDSSFDSDEDDYGDDDIQDTNHLLRRPIRKRRSRRDRSAGKAEEAAVIVEGESKTPVQKADMAAQAASIPISPEELSKEPPQGDGPGVNANIALPKPTDQQSQQQQQSEQQPGEQQQQDVKNAEKSQTAEQQQKKEGGLSLADQLKNKNLKSAEDRKLADAPPPSGGNAMNDMNVEDLISGLLGGGGDDELEEKKPESKDAKPESKPDEEKKDAKKPDAPKKPAPAPPPPPGKKGGPPPPPPPGGRGRGGPPPPPGGRGRGGPPPPPGRGRGRGGAAGGRGGVAQNKDVIKMFQDLRRALTGGGGGGGAAKKVGGGGGSSGPVDKNALLQGIMKNSKYLEDLNNDLENHSGMVKDLIKEIAQKKAADMKEMMEFIKYVDGKLSILSDETAVLKKFENWPTAKHDAMREAKAMYDKLMEMKNKMEKWKLPPKILNVQDELTKIQQYQDKTQVEMDRFIRTKDGDEAKFKEHGIPWPKTIHQEVMHGSLSLAEIYMDLVLKEVEKLNGMDLDNEKKHEKHQAKALTLLTNAVRFAFRVHQFAGGFNDGCNAKFQQLCVQTRTAMPKKDGK